MKSIKFLACMSFLLPLTAGPALAQGDIMFILDGSNSMWGKVDGTAKIETAKKALSGMLLDLPAGTRAGLMAYGHTRTEDCTDVQVLAPIGSTDARGLVSKLQSIVPKGKTPIAYALETSVRQFPKADVNNTIVLVSDGLETCGGDPCKVAGSLAKKGFDVKVHVVGFDVNKKERKQLECIATVTGGKYFQANSTEGFKEAVSRVKEEVQVAKAEPAPKPAEPKEYFRDDFDGQDLSEDWEVLNPNPDAFIVEDGQLLVVSGKAGSMAKETVENLFKLSKPLPKGDWTVTARFTIEFQTAKERVYIGIFDNGDNYLEISAKAFIWQHGSGSWWPAIDVLGIKRSKGEDKVTSRRVWDGPKLGNFGDAARGVPQPILLRLEKKGRSYIGRLMFEGGGKPKWVTLDKFTILRQKGNVVVGLYQAGNVKGESTAMVDWVKIETMQE